MLGSVHGLGKEHPLPLLLWPRWDPSRTESSAGQAGEREGWLMAPVLLPTQGRRDAPGRSRACPGRFP